jgi:hypothetical protein
MKKFKLPDLYNENGSAIIMAVFIGIALSIAIFMAIESAESDSLLMRRNREYRDNLYRSESVLSIIKEVNRVTWLDPTSNLFTPTIDYIGDPNAEQLTRLRTVDFITFPNYPAGLVSAANFLTMLDENGARIDIGICSLARIERMPLGIMQDGSGNNDPAYDTLSEKFPKLNHKAPPPIGSGASPTHFEIRRYGVNAQALNNSATIQAGLYKFFNK